MEKILSILPQLKKNYTRGWRDSARGKAFDFRSPLIKTVKARK